MNDPMQSRKEIVQKLERVFRWNARNPLTDAIAPITMRRIYEDGTEHHRCALGTAFFIKSYSGGGWFLVSNYHNFSGKDLNGGEHGSFVPNVVDVEVRTRLPTSEKGWYRIGHASLRYRLIGASFEQLYFDLIDEEESKFRGDIAILPIELPQEVADGTPAEVIVEHKAFWELSRGAETRVGEDCFVIGYPRGLQGDYREPIWKRASVASEPNNTYQRKLAFLVDTATREGMSGSPVVMRKLRAMASTSSIRTSNLDEMLEERLVGIYSGREGADEMGVQLGLVWRSELIELLISKIGDGYVLQEPVPI